MADHRLIVECKQNMEKHVKGFEGELAKVRTGRASIAMLDGIRVDYYGTMTPLNQVATLSTPDARLICIAPFEKKMIQTIEKAIQVANLGIQPTNDGNVVRLPIPALSEERRKDIVKNLQKSAETFKVSIRNERRDSNEKVKKIEKSKEVGEDESKRLQQDIQKQTDNFIKMIDERLAKKEKEVMTL